MGGIGKKLLGRPDFDNPTRIHDGDSVGKPSHKSQVVRDDEDRQIELRAQASQNIQHLGLDCHVQGRRRLIRDDHRRVAGQCHRDHDALPHSTTELVRVVTQPPRGVRHANQLKKLDGATICCLSAHREVSFEHLSDLPSDGENRV